MLPKALPPFQVLGLALFSLRENCLRARTKLGTRTYQSSVLTEDGTSDSLALDARSLLYSATGAGRVHGEPNILGISRGYRCVLSACCSNTGSRRTDESIGWHLSRWNQSVAVRSTPLFHARLHLGIRVLEPGRMPSASQVIQLINESMTR